jgi:hypothetical protein
MFITGSQFNTRSNSFNAVGMNDGKKAPARPHYTFSGVANAPRTAFGAKRQYLPTNYYSTHMGGSLNTPPVRVKK